jgi:hypothetical protein
MFGIVLPESSNRLLLEVLSAWTTAIEICGSRLGDRLLGVFGTGH